MDLAIGQVYGEKYRIARLLGQGSMGAVYEGENVRIRRKVAIKTLHQGMAEKGDTLQRFEREAQAAGRIGSKHIVEVLDMGDLPDGSRYMVMEHLEGVTLQQHIKSNGRVPPIEASAIVQQLLEGLAAAHAANIIHRDLKPANVFLVRHAGRPELVKILDFGVSKFSVLSNEMSMTRTGAVLGTPYYMSPEQAKGSRDTDARSDLYAVGVILYECITGQVPFSAETFNELLFRIVLESPPPAESFVPDLSPELAAIIRKAMAREPADRFQSAQELKKALADWQVKAEEAESPSFDGLATLDHKTVMRSGPPAQRPPAAPAGLRPAGPSITAGGTVMVGPGNPPKPGGLAAQGTVIIDPAVVPPGATPAPPNGAPANGAAGRAPANGAGRGSAATQPLPQWQDGAAGPGAAGAAGAAPMAMPGAPMPAGGAPMQMQMPGAPMPAGGAPMPAGGAEYDSNARGVYPAPVAGSPYGGGDPNAPSPYMMEAAPRAVPQRPRNAMKVVAFLGIATGLLAGVAAWAVIWRHDDEPGSDASAASVASVTSAAPSPTESAGAGAPPATATATASEAASAPATGAAPSTEPTGTGAAPAASSAGGATSGEPVLPAAPGAASAKVSSKASSTAVSAKPTATAAATGAATSAPGKPGKTNPSGGRTVSQDL